MSAAQSPGKPGRLPCKAWWQQMEREQDFPPYFTPALKAKRDKRFQAFMAAHVLWLIPQRNREGK